MIAMVFTVVVLFEHNGDLYYMYTGNHRDEQWNRYASQMIAKVQNNGAITKFDAP